MVTTKSVSLICAAIGLVPSWSCSPAAAQSQVITILPATIKPAIARPGTPIKVTYHWYGVPTTVDFVAFAHIVSGDGHVIINGDHTIPVDTTTWSGPVSYTKSLQVPGSAVDGLYVIVAGLDSKFVDPPNFVNLPIAGGAGTVALSNCRFQIGTFRVDQNAPPPPYDSDEPVTLDLTGYKMTFDDEFGSMDITKNGPPARWKSHFPGYGNFGDSKFVDVGPHSPFSVENGVLTIQARKVDGKWESGLIASLDDQANGFSQQYGYFEMRAKLPKGPGAWPAFWLLDTDRIRHQGGAKRPRPEIDIMEQYGHEPRILVTTLHRWLPDNHITESNRAYVPDLTEAFHNYGVMWDEKNIVWYFDGVEVSRCSTPPEARCPMYMMVDLALGGGWPIDQTPNPSQMLVKYVRVYARQ